MRGMAAVVFVGAMVVSGCDRSDNSRTAGAVFDDSQYGVVTAPQAGNLNEQPDVGGQLNVTTATVATSSEATLGNGAVQATDTAGQAPAETQQTTGTAE